MIKIINRQRKISVNERHLKKIIQAMLNELGYDDFDIGILLTTNATIRKYNHKYRNKDKATDVLSFPFHPDLKAGERIKVSESENKNLGDIVISLEYLKEDCARWNRSFKEHLVAILVHGVAHLLNYDHQTDAEFKVMRKVEKNLLKSVNSLN